MVYGIFRTLTREAVLVYDFNERSGPAFNPKATIFLDDRVFNAILN